MSKQTSLNQPLTIMITPKATNLILQVSKNLLLLVMNHTVKYYLHPGALQCYLKLVILQPYIL